MKIVPSYDNPSRAFGYRIDHPKDAVIKLAACLPIIGQIIGIARVAISFPPDGDFFSDNERKLYRLRGCLEILNLGLLLIPFDIWLRYSPQKWVAPDLKND